LITYQIIYGENIPIDFLADTRDEAFAKNKILQGKIILNVKPTYRFLLKDYLTVNCDGILVNVPQPDRYILHKFWIYLNEQDPRPRDITMAYYCITRSPQSKEIYQEIRKLKDENISKNVLEAFSNPKFLKDDLLVTQIESGLRSIGEEEAREVIHRKLKHLVP